MLIIIKINGHLLNRISTTKLLSSCHLKKCSQIKYNTTHNNLHDISMDAMCKTHILSMRSIKHFQDLHIKIATNRRRQL